MSTLYIVYLILFVICIGGSAFFSISEIAFVSLQRFKLERLLETKTKGAALVESLVKRPEKLLSTILLGNNFTNTAASTLGTLLAIEYFGASGALIATFGVTILVLVFGDTLPKTTGAHHAETVSLKLAGAVKTVSIIFSPFVIILSWFATSFGKMIGARPVGGSLISEEEIRTMINVGSRDGIVQKDEAEMLHKVFEFGDRPAREVMVPRTEVIWVEKGLKIEDFFKLYMERPLNRYPVFQEERDNVIGIISVKDVLMSLARGTCDVERTIDDLVRPTYFAPEGKRIGELLTEMRDQNFHLCVIVDEYGGTAGIVTLTQLVEEIVGDVKDEFSVSEKDFEIINDYTFQIDGTMRVEDVNEEMNLGLPLGEYETVAGFVLKLLGHIPKTGEQLRYKHLKLAVTRMRGRKIEEILITKEKHAALTNKVQPGT
ncbi:MAG: HlyC/CorC family transporter [Dehalococcoidales bacterium]|nr:HlyC/CorC family transporter [Dehalococcoidales bacterium]